MSDIDIEKLAYKHKKHAGDNGKLKTDETGEYEKVLNSIRDEMINTHAEELSQVLGVPEAAEKIKSLIARYITEKGLSVPGMDFDTLKNQLYYDMAGFSFLTEFIYNPDVQEINVNSWDSIEIISNEKVTLLEEKFLNPQHCQDMAKKLMRLGGCILDLKMPRGDSFISSGVRISAMIPPVVDEDTGAVFSIRKQPRKTFTLDQLISLGTATKDELDFALLCLNHNISLGIAGATFSGKTADINFFLHSLPDHLRIYTIEDSRELNAVKKDSEGRIINRVIHTRTRESEDKSRNVDQSDLVKGALRFNPDIIVPAEMRGKEAMPTQEAARTGHTVLASLHAESARDAYKRILTMCKMSGTNLSEELLMSLIIDAFPIMVFKKKLDDNSRRYMEIFEVESYKQGKVFGRTLFKYFVTGQEFDEDGKITKMVGEHRQVNPVSKHLSRKLLENGARLDEIKRFADPDWDPGRYDDGGENN